MRLNSYSLVAIPIVTARLAVLVFLSDLGLLFCYCYCYLVDTGPFAAVLYLFFLVFLLCRSF